MLTRLQLHLYWATPFSRGGLVWSFRDACITGAKLASSEGDAAAEGVRGRNPKKRRVAREPDADAANSYPRKQS